MKTFTIKTGALAAGVVALSLAAAAPASAQSRGDTGRDAILGAVVGGLAGALIGNGDGTYIAGGALAGAALGATASNRGSGCEYYRSGQCYRNQGHWEREHGIDRSNGYSYSYDRRDTRAGYRNYGQYRSAQNHRNRDYRYDRRW